MPGSRGSRPRTIGVTRWVVIDGPATDRHRHLRSHRRTPARRTVDRRTRIRDADGRMRQVRITARSAALARSILKERLLTRPGFGSAGVLRPDSGFTELAAVWLADLGLRDLAQGTKQNYRDQLRLHVQPAVRVCQGTLTALRCTRDALPRNSRDTSPCSAVFVRPAAECAAGRTHRAGTGSRANRALLLRVRESAKAGRRSRLSGPRSVRGDCRLTEAPEGCQVPLVPGHVRHLMEQPMLGRCGSGTGACANTCRIAAESRSPVTGIRLPGVEASNAPR